jgi:hypothetical protein
MGKGSIWQGGEGEHVNGMYGGGGGEHGEREHGDRDEGHREEPGDRGVVLYREWEIVAEQEQGGNEYRDGEVGEGDIERGTLR